MDASGNPSANQNPASEPVYGRRVPGSGRQKGTPNKVNRQIKEIAGKYTLRAVKEIWKLATTAKAEEVRFKALLELLAYAHGRPSQAVTVGGGETPVKVQADVSEMSSREIARRALAMFDSLGLVPQLEQALRAAKVKELPAPSQEATQEFVDAFSPPETPEPEKATPEAPAEPPEPQPVVPRPGETTRYSHDLSISCSEGSRPGLPPSYCLRRGTMALLHGSWDRISELLVKQGGDPLKGVVERPPPSGFRAARAGANWADRPEPAASASDPMIDIGYAHRKMRRAG